MKNPLGLDVGGANLKGATRDGPAVSVPFELWKHPERLADALRQLRTRFRDVDGLALTMTGELCDCFDTKRDGVRAILASVSEAFDDLPIRVWSTHGTWLSPRAAADDWLAVAAANWHAQATFVARENPQASGLLVDIGSTTTDIISFCNGQVVAEGKTDPERLHSGELLYLGTRRTPLCALGFNGVCAEFFATIHDVNVLLGHIPEDPDDRQTADGRPMTIEHAHSRVARMWGADRLMMPRAEAIAKAREVHARVVGMVMKAIATVRSRMVHKPDFLIVSGSGDFLAEEIARQTDLPVVSFAERYGRSQSHCACAYSLARLGDFHSERSDEPEALATGSDFPTP
jgi:(4-(4-[2-(gamma-L-glutamylamino)ethyl]phenoxymethyl)furan-2-yl)methanamine synthase